MSTLTCCRLPPRSRHKFAAASAEAATVACAAVPVAKDEGSTGSLPVRLTLSSALSSRPAVRSRPASTILLSGAVIRALLHFQVRIANDLAVVGIVLAQDCRVVGAAFAAGKETEARELGLDVRRLQRRLEEIGEPGNRFLRRLRRCRHTAEE